MSHLWPDLSKRSDRLIAVCLTLLVLAVGAICLTLLDLQRVSFRDARQTVSNLGTAISEQSSRSLQAVDLVLQVLQRDIARSGIMTTDQFETELKTELQQKSLRVRAEDLPQANAFVIVGADGNLVVNSRQWPVQPLSAGDRDWFEYLRDHDDPTTFVSRPSQSRVTGKAEIVLARRVNSPSGTFLGVVASVIDLEYFFDFYKSVSSDSGTAVSMLTRSGIPLVRFPRPVRIGEHIRPASDWYNIVAQGSGIYRAPGLVDPTVRIISVHALPDYPIVIDVSVAESAVLAIWRREATLIGAGTIGVVLCVLLLLRALALQLRRLEQSETSLMAQNGELAVAHHKLEVQAIEISTSRANLSEQTRALQTTLDHMNQGLMMVTADRKVAVCNQRAIEMLELPPALMATEPLYDEMMEYQSAARGFGSVEAAFPEYSRTALNFTTAHTYERKRPDGRIIEIQSIPLEDGGLVRTFTDITRRRRSEEQVRSLAYHDGLTKLVNRHAFQNELVASIEAAGAGHERLAVLYLDLDRFKSVNDTRGHLVGDTLLVEVANRMRSVVRHSDIVARMGGDEFAIVQRGLAQPKGATQLAERLLQLITAPYVIDETPCLIGISIGIALFPLHGRNANDLLRNADTALYRAKSDGRGTFRLFDTSMDARLQRMFRLEQQLREAVENHELELAYQPIVDAGSREILAFEALLRWRQKNGRFISPLDFIPLAEMSGLIVPIGLWVLETACAEAASWREDVRISVNLSPVQFRRGNLVGEIKRVLASSGLAPDRLSLEITEGLLLEGTQEVLGTMASLRELGVRFSLDDFGTAHAGLSYLRSFPFDALKIDKSFVQDAVERPESRAIVEAILAMGNALKLNVIAEGVETEDQLRLLKQMQCQQVQGHLLGVPRPAAHARSLIAKGAATSHGPGAAVRSLEG